MADMDYTFAVANIRAMEGSLFSQSIIDQLMACKNHEDALHFVIDKGWGGAGVAENDDEILAAERAKIWEVIKGLFVPMDEFSVLSYPNVFHNLKTAIKESYSDEVHDEFYYENTEPSMAELRDIIAKKEYARLPAGMDTAAADAMETLIHTGDGQLCDVIIDQACLSAIWKAGQESEEAVIRDYARTVVTTGDIKIAVRCQKTGKSADFMHRALASVESLNVEQLVKASNSGFEAICDYLSSVGLTEASNALKDSPSAFERWCDDYLMQMLRSQKYETFSIGPLVAYILARENEIKTVGIILSGKLNGLSDDSIRERIREMYV